MSFGRISSQKWSNFFPLCDLISSQNGRISSIFQLKCFKLPVPPNFFLKSVEFFPLVRITVNVNTPGFTYDLVSSILSCSMALITLSTFLTAHFFLLPAWRDLDSGNSSNSCSELK